MNSASLFKAYLKTTIMRFIQKNIDKNQFCKKSKTAK